MCAHSVAWLFQKFRAAFPSFLRCHLSLSVPVYLAMERKTVPIEKPL